MAMPLVCVPLMVREGPPAAIYLRSKGLCPGFLRPLYDPGMFKLHVLFAISNAATVLFFLAPSATIALMLSSLRAFPADSYITVDRLSSIPHI